MENVVELRKNQPFSPGETVTIGNSLEEFEIESLGVPEPVETLYLKGECRGQLVNAGEFLSLKVPGHPWAVFTIHHKFVSRKK